MILICQLFSTSVNRIFGFSFFFFFFFVFQIFVFQHYRMGFLFLTFVYHFGFLVVRCIKNHRYNTKIITGVVGGSYSEVSLQVANLLRLFRIPQVRDVVHDDDKFDWERALKAGQTTNVDKPKRQDMTPIFFFYLFRFVSSFFSLPFLLCVGRSVEPFFGR